MGLVRRAAEGEALLVSGPQGWRVCFDAAMVKPLVERCHAVDTSKRVVSARVDIWCRDGVRVQLEAELKVSIQRSADAVIQAARMLGVERMNDPGAMADLLRPLLADAVATAAAARRFEELQGSTADFAPTVLEVLQRGLGGFTFGGLTVDGVVPTPVDDLSPDHLLDAQGRVTLLRAAVDEARQERRRRHQPRLEELRRQVEDLQRRLDAARSEHG